MGHGAAHLLRVAEVEVGIRGALRRIFKGVLPFIATDMVRLVILIAFPAIALYLPSLM